MTTAAPGSSLPELVQVMKRLLAPDGCPWDREQTLETLKPFLLEETYEVLEAMDAQSADAHEHAEELGDLLMQIVFQSELRAAERKFDIDDVVRGIATKLIRRHPHIFGDAKGVDTADKVLTQWAELKQKEKKDRRTLDGVPRTLPALARAAKLTERAAAVGFDWPDVAGARAKIDEEVRELDAAVASKDAAHVKAELGDLLFAIVNVSRKLGIDPEVALGGSIDRFTKRFTHIEDRLKEQGRGPKDATLAEMDALWDEAKRNS
jgi:MazG family protein